LIKGAGFVVEVLRQHMWEDAGLGVFAKAKEAYAPAHKFWRESGVFVREGFHSKEYASPRVRVRRIGGTRAAHSFPSHCVVYK
jgi:hypothetical protein